MNLKGGKIKILPQLPMFPNFKILFLFISFEWNISDNSSQLFWFGKSGHQPTTCISKNCYSSMRHAQSSFTNFNTQYVCDHRISGLNLFLCNNTYLPITVAPFEVVTLGPSLFWDILQHRLAAGYWHFRTANQSHF
jgi:hypothetical protein